MNIKKKSLTTACGKFVDVYDNVYSFREQEFFENFLINSFYTTKSAASQTTRHLPNTYLHSRFSREDVENLKIFNNSNIKNIISSYGVEAYGEAWANLSLPGTYYQKHSDAKELEVNQITIMYYATMTWQDSFGGETFFYNDYGEKEIVVDFIPGRVVIFDSSLAHKPAFSYGHIVGRYVFVCLALVNNTKKLN
jgi:Rps23 Pro-64 3,4-dihydroxylase Tpa1-like proline 4-hydroxylase